MSSEYEPDLKLKAELERLLTYPAPSGMWSDVETRARKKGWTPEERWPAAAEDEERIGEQRQRPIRKGFPSARRSGLRVAAFACLAVVVVAVLAVGSLMAVRNLARPDFVLAITDNNAAGAGGQTTGGGTGSGYWERVRLTPGEVLVKTLVMDPSNHSVLYAQTTAGLFKSNDGARTWNQTLSFAALAAHVFVVAFDPGSPSTVYMIGWLPGDSPGLPQLLRSDDAGATWKHLTDASTPKLNGYFEALRFDTGTTPSTIFMWGNNAWYRSANRGETWTKLSQQEEGLATTVRPSLPLAAQEALEAFLVSFSGTVTDEDTRAVVAVVPGSNGVMSGAPTGTATESVIVDPDQPSIFYAPTTDGVYKSIDSGRSWRKAGTGPGDPAIGNVLVDPGAPSTLYAGTSAGVLRSTDGGRDWTPILEDEGSVALAPSNPSRLYAWTSAGLFRSDDGGEKWAALKGMGLGGPPTSGLVLVATDNPDIVFAMTLGLTGPPARLSRSTDGGNTWNEVLKGATFVVADPKKPATLFAAVSSQVFKSTDMGGTWTAVSPKQWVDAVVDIAVDPHNSSDVYTVQCSDSGAYSVSRSVDGGTTWHNVPLEGPAKYIRQLLFDPRSPGTLYVLTFQVIESVVNAGVYRSTDGGATWEDIIGKLPDTGYFNVVIDPASARGLYAATTGGLFKWVESSN
jgi:photosystem II stability/assembly factor-like uncharacterized protein